MLAGVVEVQTLEAAIHGTGRSWSVVTAHVNEVDN